MSSREQFEAHYDDWAGLRPGTTRSERIGGTYARPRVSTAWAHWQASRETMVVELPDSVANTGTLTSGAVLSYKRECKEVIEALGLKVAP